jgi:DNA-binding MarR family transcriptional regulator
MPFADRQLSGELGQELGRHARLLHMLKSRMAAWAPAGLDGAAFGLLMALVKCGPSRQGELAERSLLDPSTVSRYVGQLVKAGLVNRRPDPADGRAVQLVATEQGLAVGAEASARREQLMAELLATWSEDDARMLVILLRRLNDAMEVRRDVPPPA